MQSALNIATYNVGLPFDYRNVLLRTGQNSHSSKIKNQYALIKQLYDAAVTKFFAQEESKRIWWQHPEFQVTPEEKTVFMQDRSETIKEVCQKIFAGNDIALLQEIENKETLDLVKSTMPADYEISVAGNPEEKLDTAVVWNGKRFMKLPSIETAAKDRKVTIVALKELNSDKVIKVASVHVPGYTIVAPAKEMKAGEEFLGGDKLIQTTLDQMKQGEPADLSIVGGDFNSEYKPDYIKGRDLDLAQRRFKLLEDEGFKYAHNIFKTGFNKDLNKTHPDTQGACALDHVLTKSKLNSNITISQRFAETQKYPFDDVTKNPSDHSPLFYTINDL